MLRLKEINRWSWVTQLVSEALGFKAGDHPQGAPRARYPLCIGVTMISSTTCSLRVNTLRRVPGHVFCYLMVDAHCGKEESETVTNSRRYGTSVRPFIASVLKLYWSMWAGFNKITIDWWLRHRHWFLAVLEAGKPKIDTRADSMSGESPVPKFVDGCSRCVLTC